MAKKQRKVRACDKYAIYNFIKERKGINNNKSKVKCVEGKVTPFFKNKSKNP